MKAAIYCRVSTEDQEREGTSLQSQLEACKKLAQEQGYEAPEEFIFKETYSGLSIDRPKLNEVRQYVREKRLDMVIAYTLDRLSRDPVHFIILQEELEKAGVKIILVTEDVDSSDMGKLISHIKGFAAKLEAEKIRERSMRGKRTRVLGGHLTCGGGVKLYGYNYVSGKGLGEGIRFINESEAKWVRNIFKWYAEDNLTMNSIVYRLRSLGVPSPKGNNVWTRGTLQKMLHNTCYKGVTYAFKWARAKSGNKYVVERPKEDWIELPGATPAIVSENTFELAQVRLKRNRELAIRNTKWEYLLRSYVFCIRCGRRYSGATRTNMTRKGINRHRFYHCSKSVKKVFIDPCRNRTWSANKLEEIVWKQIENVLTNPEVVLVGLKTLQSESDKVNEHLGQLGILTTTLTHLEKEKDRTWKAFRITGDEQKFKREIEDVMLAIEENNKKKLDLEYRIYSAKQSDASFESIKHACELVRSNLGTLSFNDKRETLEALNIKVLIDKDYLKLEGELPIVSTTSMRHEVGRLLCAWQ
ncbi:recombinase family protein [Chloroflexota bacterium]